MRSSLKAVSFHLLIIAALLGSPACSLVKRECTCHEAENRRLITVETLRASLPEHPIVSGFDIDDTVLFSSPGFYYGLNNSDGPGGSNKYGQTPLGNLLFWNDMNREFDKFSIPKEAGRALLRIHQDRGDAIVFITARVCGTEDKAALESRLKFAFKLREAKVICSNGEAKKRFIEENGIDIYYGDADTDIESARAASRKKVRPIRVQRSPLSTNKPGYTPGAFGEEILINSEN